jgi:hypothetical protein
MFYWLPEVEVAVQVAHLGQVVVEEEQVVIENWLISE